MRCGPLASGLAEAVVLRCLSWKLPAGQRRRCYLSLVFRVPPCPVRTLLSCVLQVELGQRPTVERAPPVTEEEWDRHVGPEGRLQCVPELKNRIFSGVSVCGCKLGWVGRWLGGSPLTCCFITLPGSQPWPSAGGLEVPSWVPQLGEFS